MGRNALILWLIAGTGTVLIYSAVKNVTPQSLILATIGTGKLTQLNGTPATPTDQASDAGPTTAPKTKAPKVSGGFGGFSFGSAPTAYDKNGKPSATLIQT